MAAHLPLLPKLLCLWSSIMPTKNMNCSPVSLEQNDSTSMSLAMPSLLRVTVSFLNRSTSRIWQIHQFIYRECCSDSKTMMSPSSIDLAKRWWLQMPFLTMHPSRLQRYLRTSSSTMCTSHLTGKLSSRISSKMTYSSTPLLRQSLHVGQTYQ